MTYPTMQAIPETMMSFDDSLTQDPIVTPLGATSLLNGTIFVTGKDGAIAYDPILMPFIDSASTQEFQMFISDYMFNSGIANARENGLLSFTYPLDLINYNNLQNIPITIPNQKIVTDDLATFLPSIVPAIGSGIEVQVKCMGTKKREGITPLSVKSTDTEMTLYGAMTCVMSSWDATNSAWSDFLGYTTDIAMNGTLALDAGNMLKVTANSAFVENTKVDNSMISDITGELITSMVNSQLTGLLPMSKEFAIPISNYVNLVNPVVSYHSGYVKILSNALFEGLTC